MITLYSLNPSVIARKFWLKWKYGINLDGVDPFGWYDEMNGDYHLTFIRHGSRWTESHDYNLTTGMDTVNAVPVMNGKDDWDHQRRYVINCDRRD